ncbi:MAG: 30S ribosomal protein S4 [Deltaproteobacteria bacterium]|nr:30S ribosomal protein S4 [Deltaproteobacteria bacterium]
MARYTGSVCRLCRREGMKLFLKGERCFTDRCSIERRNYPPGQHGQARPRFSDYGNQLREKQKVRRLYGVLERQFRITVREAERMKGVAGHNLLELLERRLDNTVYRLGMATSRSEARQLVRHGHFTMNGRRLTVPSARVREGDVIGLTARGAKAARIEGALDAVDARALPAWLSLDKSQKTAEIVGRPQREEITIPIQEQLITELYSSR